MARLCERNFRGRRRLHHESLAHDRSRLIMSCDATVHLSEAEETKNKDGQE